MQLLVIHVELIKKTFFFFINQRSLQNPSSTLIEENQNKTNVGTLLDFGDEDFNQDLVFERSFSSNGQ
jgi:hypothetical protein